MSLKPFTYPFPETRFLHSGSNVYKFKIRYGNRVRKEDVENKEVIVQELEDSIRVVLGNLDNLQPFTTKHFIIFPYKSRWERVSHLKFKHGEVALVPYPFVLTLYVEMKWFHENLSPEYSMASTEYLKERYLPIFNLQGRHSLLTEGQVDTCRFDLGNGKPIHDSAVGLVLNEREAAGALRKKRKRTEASGSPSRPGLDRDRVRTSGQGPSRKKLLVETSREHRKRRYSRTSRENLAQTGRLPLSAQRTKAGRRERGASATASLELGVAVKNQERKTQQECQETSAFGVTDVLEQDPRWEAGRAGDGILPGQQSSPSPPQGPADLGTSGLFGFLSSLFPFRYFFRRSSQ